MIEEVKPKRRGRPPKIKPTEPTLVEMTKGDKSANVHPDEVENYKLGDWRVRGG